MALNNAIVRNKTIIQEILSADHKFILDKVIEKELITGREYTKLKSINKGDAEDLVIKLVDTLINKGRQSEFIELLQDEKVLETYPKLKVVEWGDSGSTASSSSLSIGHGDNKTVVEPWEKTRELGRIGSELIDWLSDDDVIDLLYYLRKMDVLNDQEMKILEEKMTREDKERCLIDTLMKKGERESSLMVDYLMERHPDLCRTLGLTPTSSRIKLGRIRSKLIDRLSYDDVIDLLYYLMKMDVLNDQEMKTVEGKLTSKDRARCLIYTVMKKGEGERSLMVDYLSERHPELCWTLGLTPTSAWINSIIETRSAGPDLSDKQLLEVVKTLGQEWEQVAIHLEMDDIKADGQTDVAMQKLKMLAQWRQRRPPGKTTAQDLLRGLKDMEDLPVGTLQLLTGELRRIRSEFVMVVSTPVIKGLLDDLWQQKVFSTDEMDSVMDERSRADRARCLIAMVMWKGERASQMMIDSMKKRDGHLCSTLGLISSPAGGLKAEVKLKRLFSRARDKKTRSAGQDLSDEHLMKVAETLGQEWEQAAIYLELSITDLDDIKAEHRPVAMQKLKMLVLWKRRRPPGEATAQDLLRGLEDLEDLPDETRQLLRGRPLSNEQLLKVAETLGLEWEQAAIHLDLKTEDLDGIKAENMTLIMQKYKMLQLWQSQRPFGKDTAQDLLRGLEDMEDLPVETRLLLTGFGRSHESFGSGQESPGQMSPSLPLEMQEGDSELGYVTKDPELDLMSEESGIGSMSDSDSCSESSRSESMSESELAVDGKMLGLGDDKMVGKPKKQRRVPNAVFDEEDEDLRSKVERWDTDPSAVIDEEDEGTSLTEDIASMSLMDRCEEEDCSDSEASAEIDEEDEEEMHFKSRCEKCKAAQQSPEYEKVTPTKISKWSFEVQLEGEGTYECSATGLVFEVSEQVLVRYSVLSWCQFSEFLQDSWRPAGSVYDVDVVNKDPAVLKFIHFPHSLCLAEPLHELSFSVLHVKGGHANIESTVDFTASHVKWRVSSLSWLGLILRSIQSFLSIWNWKHQGLVLIYKELNKKDSIFQVYLGSNTDSEIQAIDKQVKARKNGSRITETYRHHICRLEEKFYCLASEPEGQIEPTNLEFTTAVLGLKGFFEVRFSERRPPFKLFLKDPDWDKTLLEFTIRDDDWPSEDEPEVTSDLPSSPRLSLEHPAGHTTSSTTSSPPAPSRATQAERAEDLKRIRSGFVGRVGLPALKCLLDDLWQRNMLSTDDKDTVMENQTNRTDRARFLIDMVIAKGERASQAMIDCMLERDRELCLTLGLILPPSPTDRVGGSLLAGSQEVKAPYKVSPTETKGRTSELILSCEQFKTEKLKDQDIYPIMAPANRTRMALLITNVRFDTAKYRHGAEKDEQDMSKLLISLGYNVEPLRDLTGEEMEKAVESFSKDPLLATTDSVFVVIMSHGMKGAILGVHHGKGVTDKFPIDDIFKHLDSAHCPQLEGKPKVIIIQACRGVDDGSAIVTDGPRSVPEQAPVVQVDAALPPHLADEVDADIEEDASHRVHKEKDMVSLLSCTADTVSYRHTSQGSFFIQHLVEIFNRHAHEDHIEKLFKRVLKRFEDEPPSANRRQMPVKDRCTLTRDFYLFPRT